MEPTPSPTGTSTPTTSTAAISEINSFLASHFPPNQIPSFSLTPRSISTLHSIVSLSTSRSRSASIVAADLRSKAAEYRAQAARVKEILDAIGLGFDKLSPNAVDCVKVVAKVADLVSVRDTEDSRTFAKFEKDVAAREALMGQWKTNMDIMDAKEKQYMLQQSNYKAILTRVGYTPEINHGVLMEMSEHRKDLEKKTKPILDTLRSYQDLPPDKALAALAIEDKKRQYAAAEKQLEEVLHSAFDPLE